MKQQELSSDDGGSKEQAPTTAWALSICQVVLMVIVLILVTQTPQVCVMTRMIQFYNNIGCEQFSPAKLYDVARIFRQSILFRLQIKDFTALGFDLKHQLLTRYPELPPFGTLFTFFVTGIGIVERVVHTALVTGSPASKSREGITAAVMVFLWVLCTAMMGFMAFFYYQMDLVYIIYNMLQETGQSPREIDIVMKSIYESYFANIFVYYAEWVVALFCCFFILITFVVELCLVLCKPERYYGREISWGFGTPASDHKSFNSWLRAQKAAAQSRPVSRHQHGTGNIYSIADPSKEEGLYSGRSTAQAMGEGHIAPADSMQSVQLASPHHPRVLASATVGPGERLV